VQVPAGDYQWVRIEIDPAESYVIASNGGRYALDAPSLFQSTADFTVGEGLTANMLVDIDLHMALSAETQGGVTLYTLKPISRLVNLKAVGTIRGTAPGGLMVGKLALTDPRCDPQLYAYAGAGVVPAGYFVPVKGGQSPFATAPLALNINQDIYSFNMGLLPAGNYTVAITCGAADAPGSKSIDFSPSQDAQVTVGNSTTVTF
jgi:hypothetical protein